MSYETTNEAATVVAVWLAASAQHGALDDLAAALDVETPAAEATPRDSGETTALPPGIQQRRPAVTGRGEQRAGRRCHAYPRHAQQPPKRFEQQPAPTRAVPRAASSAQKRSLSRGTNVVEKRYVTDAHHSPVQIQQYFRTRIHANPLVAQAPHTSSGPARPSWPETCAGTPSWPAQLRREPTRHGTGVGMPLLRAPA